MKSAPIFIVGMPRSGTTLLSSMLSAHSRITISPETHFISQWVAKHPGSNAEKPASFDQFWEAWSASERFDHLGIDAASTRQRIEAAGTFTFRSIFDACMQAYAESVGKVRWGEKTPAHVSYVDILSNWYPDCRIICMVRDPRAVTASILKTPWGSQSVELNTRNWNRVMDVIHLHRQDPRYTTVRYEELVGNPEEELRRICDHIREEYEMKMLDQRDQAVERVDRRSGWAQEQILQSQRPISTAGVDKWRKQLSRAQVQIIEHLSRRYRRCLGYEDTTDNLPLAARAHLGIQEAARRARRFVARLRRWFWTPGDQG